MLPVVTIRDLKGSFEAEDGRLTMADRDDEAVLRMRGARVQPLGEYDPVASIEIAGDGFAVELELHRSALEGLTEALKDMPGQWEDADV